MADGTKALTDAEVRAGLAGLPGWSSEDGAIRRIYDTDGWRASLLVANAIGFLCEAADHHADVGVSWPRVTVALSTHSAGGITRKDLELAQLIERQVTWRPGADSALSGPSSPFVRSGR